MATISCGLKATPDELVVAEGVPSVAEAPVPGAVKVTVTPETGLPPLSVTLADSAVPNAVRMVVD